MVYAYFMLSHWLHHYEFIGINKGDKVLSDLDMLVLSLRKANVDWVITEYRGNEVYIWSEFEEEDYDIWDEIPKLILTKENYDEIIHKWDQVLEQKPKYVVLSYDEDNSGRIDIEQKYTLSQEDWQYLDPQKHEKLSKKTIEEAMNFQNDNKKS